MPNKAETTIRPTKAKAIRQSHINLSWLRLVRRIITVKSLRQTMEVNSWRHDILSPGR